MDTIWDCLLTNCRLASFIDNEQPYGRIDDAAIGWTDGIITFAGPQSELPGPPGTLAHHVDSLQGAWVTPGLIDCHTHLVFAGDRAREFEQRLNGVSYEEIARAGGGINSTVRRTRAASADDLLAQSLPRARALRADVSCRLAPSKNRK